MSVAVIGRSMSSAEQWLRRHREYLTLSEKPVVLSEQSVLEGRARGVRFAFVILLDNLSPMEAWFDLFEPRLEPGAVIVRDLEWR